jgi:hypothetical protein
VIFQFLCLTKKKLHCSLHFVTHLFSFHFSQMLAASQTESSTDSSLISDVEQALDRVYLPTLPGEAPLQTEILETFELTIGNSVALTSENVVTYVNNRKYIRTSINIGCYI